MSDVAFYHLTKFSLEQALPKLLEKTYGLGKRALVLVGSEDRAEQLADELWTYQPDSWLPHGTQKDGRPEKQPVWISSQKDNVNGADFLFLTDQMENAEIDTFERCFVIFDGRIDQAVQAARQQWKTYKEAGHALTYWQQTEQGGWEKKA